MAKLFRYVNTVNIEFIKLDLELPFSWQMFFLGAFFASIGNSIYAVKCPSIIKIFENYSDFKNSGRGKQQLLNEFAIIFAENCSKNSSEFAKYLTFKSSFCESENNEDLHEKHKLVLVEKIRNLKIKPDCVQDAFWYFYDFANDLELVCRRICKISYSLGLSCFFVVLVQNIWFVFINTFFK
jgi:hypothetical protein